MATPDVESPAATPATAAPPDAPPPDATSPVVPWRKHLTATAIPDPSALGQVERLCWLPEPYRDDRETDELFIAALNELNAWHVDRLDLYARIWRSAGAPRIATVDDLDRQPYLHANLFKRHVIRSVPAEAIKVELASSGTSGTPSRMCFDTWSARTVQRLDTRTFEHFGWTSAEQPVNYLMFGKEPHPLAQDEVRSGAAYSTEYICDFAPARSIGYALRHNGHDHEFDLIGCVDALLRHSRDDIPTRIFGFPSLLVFTLDRLRAIGAPALTLPPGSLVLTGGGWKGYQDQHIAKDELVRRVEDQLGVPSERVRDIWGSVEHPLPYYECPRHHIHVPTWARVLVRSVRDLRPLPDGEPGYLQLISPYITSSPAHSVLMADLVTRYPASECGCGIPTPWLDIHGRAGTSRNRGCAVAAAELLGGHR